MPELEILKWSPTTNENGNLLLNYQELDITPDKYHMYIRIKKLLTAVQADGVKQQETYLYIQRKDQKQTTVTISCNIRQDRFSQNKYTKRKKYSKWTRPTPIEDF